MDADWLSTLPENTPVRELVRLAKIRWRIEHDYRDLRTGLGLAHFEGRTYAGWLHHMTLVTAAHLFITTLRLTRKGMSKKPSSPQVGLAFRLADAITLLYHTRLGLASCVMPTLNVPGSKYW